MPAKKKPRSKPFTQKRLISLFNHFNKTYFGGKCERPLHLRIGAIAKENLGEVTILAFGKGGTLIPVDLVINKRLRWAPILCSFVLLHEMAHLAAHELGHGVRFKQQVRRLLSNGAIARIFI